MMTLGMRPESTSLRLGAAQQGDELVEDDLDDRLTRA